MSSKTLTLTKKRTKLDSVHLPKFPTFVPLEPHHQTHIENLFKTYQPYSDYNFFSLWSWDHQRKLRISTLNNNLVIKFQDYQDDKKFFYSFFGTNKVDLTAKSLLINRPKGIDDTLRLIPEFVVNSIKYPDTYDINEDRDNHDYIIAIKNLVDLEGKHNRTKRRYLNQFVTTHKDEFIVSELDIARDEDKRQIKSVIKIWESDTEDSDGFNQSEIKAMGKILENHHTISTSNLHIVGIYMGSDLKAFMITEILNSEMAIGHYKKTDRSIRGLGTALDHFTAASLNKRGVTKMNIEQDLGVEGLKKWKMMNQPIDFLKKYTISLPKK